MTHCELCDTSKCSYGVLSYHGIGEECMVVEYRKGGRGCLRADHDMGVVVLECQVL